MSATPLHPSDPKAPLDRAAVRAAAAWLARLHAADANADDLAACECWRKASPEHERAWQRAMQVHQDIGQLPPAVARQVLARPEPARRRALRGLGALALAAPTGYMAWTIWGHTLVADHHTAVGERRDVVLPDGTRLHLNTDTALDVAYTQAQRRIVLRHGELMVETAADAARPFLLGTAWGDLRALGTRFLVRSGHERARLAVFEGAVAARLSHGAAQTVAADLAVDFDGETFSPLRQADPHDVSWTRGLLVAQAQRLDDFLLALGRYRRGMLHCDPAVAHLRVSGAFQLDHGEEVLDALPATLPVRVVWRTRWWASVLPRA